MMSVIDGSRAARRVATTIVFAILLALAATPQATRAAEEDLKTRQATIKGLVIRRLENGKMTGLAIGIVATASGDTTGGRVSIRGDIGKQMTSALEESERYVRVKHRSLGNADIEISFEERYSPKDGGSAGTAFSVLLRSLAEGFEIDPAVSITGDIAVNGTVQPIGGVTAKLRGAKVDGSTISIIPKANVPAVADMLLSAEKIDILANQQILFAETVDDAIAVARKDRPKKLADAMRMYSEVQSALTTRRLPALREPAIVAKLKNVIEFAPNHVSARYALDIATNNGPKTLTRTASLIEVYTAAAPFRDGVGPKGELTREGLPTSVIRDVMKELGSLRLIVHPDVEPMRSSVVAWIDAVDRILSAKKPISNADREIIEKRRQNLISAMKKLDTDESLVEKMSREGY